MLVLLCRHFHIYLYIGVFMANNSLPRCAIKMDFYFWPRLYDRFKKPLRKGRGMEAGDPFTQ